MALTELKSRSDVDLLQRLKSGDDRAWAEFVQTYSGRLYNYLYNNLPNAEDVEDVVSETLLAAVKAIPNFDGQATLLTFVYALANRKLADFWRKRPATVELTETIQADGINTQQVEFQEALNRLTDKNRRILLLRYSEGLSVPEIAEVLSCTYKAAESSLSRAREELRNVLNELGSDDDKKSP